MFTDIHQVDRDNDSIAFKTQSWKFLEGKAPYKIWRAQRRWQYSTFNKYKNPHPRNSDRNSILLHLITTITIIFNTLTDFYQNFNNSLQKNISQKYVAHNVKTPLSPIMPYRYVGRISGWYISFILYKLAPNNSKILQSQFQIQDHLLSIHDTQTPTHRNASINFILKDENAVSNITNPIRVEGASFTAVGLVCLG